MPQIDEQFVRRLEALIKPHESSGFERLANWVSTFIPLGVLLVSTVTFYVLTNSRLAILEAQEAKFEQQAEVARQERTENLLRLQAITQRLERLETRK